jgi:predicted hydrolase (HD superfamily)
MKDKAFARAVSRDDMLKGAQELGMEFDELVACLVKALSARSDQLGL